MPHGRCFRRTHAGNQDHRWQRSAHSESDGRSHQRCKIRWRVFQPLSDHRSCEQQGNATDLRCSCVRIARRADRHRRRTRHRPSLGQDNINKGIKAVVLGLVVGTRAQRSTIWLFGLIADIALVLQPRIAARDLSAVPGHAHHARHCRYRADARHGHRRERADLRTYPRGIAQRLDAARVDTRRLRKSVGHDSRRQRHASCSQRSD